MTNRSIYLMVTIFGLIVVILALGSENCLPLQKDPCFLRGDGENIIGIFIGLAIMATGGILMLSKKHK